MAISAVISQMLVLFLILGVGYIANKTNILPREANKALSKIIVNINLSALILASVMTVKDKIPVADLGVLLCVSFLAYGILGIIGYFSPRILAVPKESRGAYSFMAMFGNVGFIGFPILAAVYSKEAVFYAALFNIPFNLLIFSIGVFMIAPSQKLKIDKKTFLNAPLIASVLALILYLLPVQFPSFIIESVDILGSMTIPGAMLVVGASLGEVKIITVFNDVRIYLIAIVKNLVCPIAIWLIFREFIDNPMILAVAVITTAMPVATNATMLAMEYGGDEALTAKGIFISTLLSIFTIPLLIFLIT